MNRLVTFANRIHDLLDRTRKWDFLAPLLIRLFLSVVFISAGWNKLGSFDSTVAWFGNPDWGLGLPFPAVMAFLATAAELVGGFFLLAGLVTRYFAVPLMITMLVAAFSGIILGGIWLLKKNQPLLHTPVPFGPFLCLGGLLVYLLQQSGWMPWQMELIAF